MPRRCTEAKCSKTKQGQKARKMHKGKKHGSKPLELKSPEANQRAKKLRRKLRVKSLEADYEPNAETKNQD